MDIVAGSLNIVAATTVKGPHSSRKANSNKMTCELPVNIYDNNCLTRAPRRIISEGLKLVAVAARICRYMNSQVLGLTTWGACRRKERCTSNCIKVSGARFAL